LAELYSTWKQLKHLTLDGVRYDIAAKQREDGHLSVAWVCLNCCEQGPVLPAADHGAGTLAFAEAGLRAHHALIHGHAAALPELEQSNAGACSLITTRCQRADRCRAAHERAKAAFGKLCAANVALRRCGTNFGRPALAASRELQSAAREFGAALIEYSKALERRANELLIE
jgi:hypothetical protein